MKTIYFTRINNDLNGNPRVVCHFFNLLTEDEIQNNDLSTSYNIAVKRANKIGGRKYHTKRYGGGIVFQCFNKKELNQSINELINEETNGTKRI